MVTTMSSQQWALEEPQEQYLIPNITGLTRRIGSLPHSLPLRDCEASSKPLSFAYSFTSLRHLTSPLSGTFLSLTKSQIRSRENRLQHRKRRKDGMKGDAALPGGG